MVKHASQHQHSTSDAGGNLAAHQLALGSLVAAVSDMTANLSQRHAA